MNLEEFSILALKTSNDAKNFISFLIGNFPKDNNSGKAILGMFESFPENYKKEKELFAPVFLKFFTEYDLTKENFLYYEDYSPLWISSNIEKIKKKNNSWRWEKTEYKNSLELTKAIFLYRGEYKQPSKLNYFLDNNSDNIIKLIKKDKEKLELNFFKNGSWELIIKNDYQFYTDFCKKYGFNNIEILKEIGNNYHGVSKFEHYINQNNFESMFEDINLYGSDNFFEKSKFFVSRTDEDLDNYNNVLDFIIILISNNRVFEAALLIKTFPCQITHCMKRYTDIGSHEDNVILKNNITENIENCANAIFKSLQFRYNHTKESKELNSYRSKFKSEIDNFKLHMSKIDLKNELDNDLQDKEQKTRKPKL